MINFRPLYDNHNIYGGFNKSKSTLGYLGKQKADKLNCIDNSLSIKNCQQPFFLFQESAYSYYTPSYW